MISWLITTFNRKRQFKNTLERMKFLTLPDELVVVDDGDDETGEMIKEVGLDIPTIYIPRPHTYYDVCGISRNIGIKKCSGDIIVISDPECLFITDAIAQMKEQNEEIPESVITAGTVYGTRRDTPMVHHLLVPSPERMLAEVWRVKEYGTETSDLTEVIKTQNWAASYIVWYKKQWLMDIGGYDEDMSLTRGGGGYAYDDVDLFTRLSINGHTQVVNKDIECIHQWHLPPEGKTGQGGFKNFEIMEAKDLYGEKYNPLKDNPAVVANAGREWGVE